LWGVRCVSGRCYLVGLAGTTSTAARLSWDRPSVSVRWRPPLSVAIVTHLVTRPLAAGRERLLPHTLSKSVGLSSPRFKRVRDLGRLSCVLCAERLRMKTNETTNETRVCQPQVPATSG